MKYFFRRLLTMSVVIALGLGLLFVPNLFVRSVPAQADNPCSSGQYTCYNVTLSFQWGNAPSNVSPPCNCTVTSMSVSGVLEVNYSPSSTTYSSGDLASGTMFLVQNVSSGGDLFGVESWKIGIWYGGGCFASGSSSFGLGIVNGMWTEATGGQINFSIYLGYGNINSLNTNASGTVYDTNQGKCVPVNQDPSFVPPYPNYISFAEINTSNITAGSKLATTTVCPCHATTGGASGHATLSIGQQISSTTHTSRSSTISQSTSFGNHSISTVDHTPSTTFSSIASISVSCSPDPQEVGSSIACTATVNSAEFSVNSAQVIDWSSDSLTGGFSSGLISSTSCFLALPNNSCTIDYTDSSAGNFTITAFYEGDALNPSTSGSTVVAYRLPVNVNIWCRSSVGIVGHPDVCAALIDGTSPGLYPTGEVTVVANSTGFGVKPDDCQIGRISGTLGTFQFNAVNGCLFDVNANVSGTATVYAAYHGDNYYMPDVVATQLKFVNLTATSLSLSCSALTALKGIQAKCTAKVVSDPPTGNVSWNATGSGSFSSYVCVLDNGTCGVTYSQSNASAATITALYEGDATHAPSESTVTVAPVTNGTAFALQTLQTGVDVTLTGSTGTLVSIYTSDYLSQPNGTGTPPFHNAHFIDVMVSGGTAGSATICYYGPEINNTTQMSYYSSGKWSAATNENASAGFDVCGNIPVVSLTGTPIAIGDANLASGSLGGGLHQLFANDLEIGGVAIPILYIAIAAVAAVILLGIATFATRKGRKQESWS